MSNSLLLPSNALSNSLCSVLLTLFKFPASGGSQEGKGRKKRRREGEGEGGKKRRREGGGREEGRNEARQEVREEI